MTEEINIYQTMSELHRVNETFAIATVIETRGASSGRSGDKAIFSQDGRRLAGWIGGGCVERMVGEAVIEAVAEFTIKTVDIDLQGENFLMTVPCGGEMKVLVEPTYPSPELLVHGSGQIVETLVMMAASVGFSVTVQAPKRDVDRYSSANQVITDDRDIEQFSPMPQFVVLGAHMPEDNMRAAEALKLGIPYVAVIASRKRSALLQKFLTEQGIGEENLLNLYAPAGLAIEAKAPEEIALSILAEMVAHKNGGTGAALRLPVTEP